MVENCRLHGIDITPAWDVMGPKTPKEITNWQHIGEAVARYNHRETIWTKFGRWIGCYRVNE